MPIEEVDTIAVLGAGTMGHGIAEVAAIAGYDVRLRDINDELVNEGYEKIEWSLGKLVEHDRLSDEDADDALGRIEPVVPVVDAVTNADVVIEAAPEKLAIKREVFEEVSEHAPDTAIFASNTSSLSISEIGATTDRPEQFCGMHFFNPPVRMDLVEVIAGENTTEQTLETIERLAENMDKTPIRVHKDTPGFVVNRVLVPLMNEAAWIVHKEEATIEAVDATGKYDMGLPMGAFELSDQVGIDVAYHVLEYIHEELGSRYEPCPLLAEKVEDGDLGKKTGRGFYDYDNGGVSVAGEASSEALAERMYAVMADEVAQLIDENVAPPSAIDTALELGAGFPDGPAKLADEYGIEDLVEHLEARHDETGASRYAVSDALRTIAAEGGFYPPGEDVEKPGLTFDDIRIEYPADHVGQIVIDRPHRMNAIAPSVLEELPQAVSRLESEEDVRVILLTGEGDRAFSAGADVQAMAAVWGDPAQAVDLAQTGQSAFGRLQKTDLIVVAAIDGYCLGGGMELATAADLRIASDRSTFSQPERDLGIYPVWGGTQRLAPLVGMGRAKEIILTGDRYDAATMAEYGFVNRVFDAEGFDEAAIEFAADIAAGPPIAQAFTKRAMNLGVPSEDPGLEIEAQAFAQIIETDDVNEGISAFLEDRDPEFEGA